MEFQPMSPEEIERTMQFMLHQQARVEANLASLSEKTDRMADGIVALTALVNRGERKVDEVAAGNAAVREGLIGLTGIVGRMSERVDRVGERIDQRLDRMAEAGKRTDQRLDRLVEAQEGTDQRINKLGDYFKRHLREDHGPRPS